MNAIKAMWKGGRIVPTEPVDWPEGCEVVVEPLPVTAFKIGLDESEWRDDPASRADWDAWIQTIEPLEFTSDEAAASSASAIVPWCPQTAILPPSRD